MEAVLAERVVATEDLLTCARAGRAGAAERLVRSHAGPMLRVARRYLRDEGEAQAVVQEAFRRAFQARSGCEASASPTDYLHGLARKLALARLRGRRWPPETEIAPLLPRFREDGAHAVPPGRWRRPARVAGSDLAGRVQRCVDRLPEPWRAVFLLSDVDGFERRTIAHELGMSEEGVRARLHQARLALRTLLDPHLRSSEED